MCQDTKDLAYLGGLFDGEGCVTIVQDKRRKDLVRNARAYICMSNTHKNTVDTFSAVFGSKTYPCRRSYGKPIWQWNLSTIIKVRNFLLQMIPFLKIKKLQAEAALMLTEHPVQNKIPLSKEDAYVRELCVRKIKQCNKGLWDNPTEPGYGGDK